MLQSQRILELMTKTDSDWQTYTKSANQAIHRVAMTASRDMMKLLGKAEVTPGGRISIADRVKIIEKAAAKFKKLANERISEGVADGEPRMALRDYCNDLLKITGLNGDLCERLLYEIF